MKESNSVGLDTIVELSIRRGILFPTASIYGSLSGFFDWGPIGVEIRKNVLDSWWDYFVRSRDDIVGIHGSIITHPRVWEASGHIDEFIDILIECTKCKSRYRADHLLEDYGVRIEQLNIDMINKLIKEKNVTCPKCGGDLGEAKPFNLMFETFVGPQKDKSSVAYLRPETAQLIFINFKNVMLSARMKIPFGVAQIGKVFRNEISPRNFIFRVREFEQMEIEYFVNPKELNNCPYFDSIEEYKFMLLPAERQGEGSDEALEIKAADAVEMGYIKYTWHAYWIIESLKWLESLGINMKNIRVREHTKSELSHYAVQTFDIEYNFPFLGWKEIVGIANRGDFDLRRHSEYSKTNMTVIDDHGERYIPHVIEPSFGLERVVLTIITDSYRVIEGRTVLSLKPKIAPFKVGVYPLLKRKEFIQKSMEVYSMLKTRFLNVFYDESGSIGKRYARADEIGVPLGVTIDHQTLEDNTVTIRFRDTREQIRVHIDKLIEKIQTLLS